MSTKLTDRQNLLLTTAAQRGDRCLALPGEVKGAVAHKIAGKLIADGLVREIKAKSGLPVWRTDEGATYSLKLTAAGAKAANSAVDEVVEPLQSDSEREAVEALPAARLGSPPDPAIAGASHEIVSPRGGTKIARVLGLLQRTVGATLEELVASTGWLPHTTRAALTGLRRRGYAVNLDRSDQTRGSTYRIARGEEDKGDGIARETAADQSALASGYVKRRGARQVSRMVA